MKLLDLLTPLPNLKVVIRGGATGIGAVIAKAFYDVGAQVYIGDINAGAVERMKIDYPGLHGAITL